MKLTPELQYIQEKLVLAAHPGLSLKEARQEEQWLFGCLYGRYSSEYSEELTIGKYVCTKVPDEYTIYPVLLVNGKQIKGDGDYDYEIIGLPPTLSRVLNGLGDATCYDVYTQSIYGINDRYERSTICNRKLLNDDGSEMTLFEQSNETISTIARELGYNSLQSE